MIYRMVYEQNGKEEVSSVVLAEHERSEQIKAEASMHLFGGWAVTLLPADPDRCGDLLFDGSDVTEAVMVSPRGGVVRRIWCRAFDPATDGTEGM